MMKYRTIWVDDLQGTPAAADRFKQIIYIERKGFKRLTPFEKKFILLHEEGHIALNTSDEQAADNYAFERLAGTEFRSLKQSVWTLSKLLKKGNPTRFDRVWNLYTKALQWDADHGNQSAADELEAINVDPSKLDGAKGIWWDNGLHFGDKKKSESEAAYRYAQVEELKKLTDASIKANEAKVEELKGQNARNSKIITFAIISASVILILMK